MPLNIEQPKFHTHRVTDRSERQTRSALSAGISPAPWNPRKYRLNLESGKSSLEINLHRHYPMLLIGFHQLMNKQRRAITTIRKAMAVRVTDRLGCMHGGTYRMPITRV